MALFLSEQQLEDRQEKIFLQAVNEAYFGRTPGINSLFNAYKWYICSLCFFWIFN